MFTRQACVLGIVVVLAGVPLEGKILAAVWPNGRRRLGSNPLDGKVVGSNISSSTYLRRVIAPR